MFSVEVGDVEGELEIVGNLSSFLVVHLVHDETGNVSGEVHESDGTGTSTESKVLAVLLDTKGLTHWTLEHELGVVTLHA